MAHDKRRRPGQGAPQDSTTTATDRYSDHSTSNHPAPQPILLTVKDAARVLGISPRLVWARSRGVDPIPSVRIGRRVVYRVSDLHDWAAKLPPGFPV